MNAHTPATIRQRLEHIWQHEPLRNALNVTCWHQSDTPMPAPRKGKRLEPKKARPRADYYANR